MEYEHTVNRCAFVLSSECIFRYLGQCYHVSLQDAVICNPEPLTKTGGKIFVVFFKYTTLMFLKKCFSSLLLFSCDTKLHQSSTVKSLLHSTYEVVLLKIETKMVGLCYLYPHVVQWETGGMGTPVFVTLLSLPTCCATEVPVPILIACAQCHKQNLLHVWVH